MVFEFRELNTYRLVIRTISKLTIFKPYLIKSIKRALSQSVEIIFRCSCHSYVKTLKK